MGLSADYIYQYSLDLINKNQAPTYSPDNFFYIWNSEQRSLQADMLGRFQPRANNKTGNNTGLIENETVLTALIPFTKNVSIPISGGQGIKPSDSLYDLAMRAGTTRIYRLNKGQWYSVQQSVIDPPDINGTCYYTDYANYFSVLPVSISSVDYDYICDVTNVVWAFIIDGNNTAVYDPGNSIQPLWAATEIIEITKRTLKSMGVRFSSQDFENFGQSAINSGS
jgi:hypothetical protein